VAGLATVRGTVWLYGGFDGIERASSGSVFAWIEGVESPTVVPISGSEGRFQFNAPQGARVYVTGSYPQPCVATAAAGGEVTLDLHGVVEPRLLGANLPAALKSQQPTLTGMVYEQTLQGRRPVPNATVQLNTRSGLGPIVARTRTDDEGRYVLCGVSPITGLAVLASAIEYQQVTSSGDIAGISTFDIELRSIATSAR
jgi:hypothetical protein